MVIIATWDLVIIPWKAVLSEGHKLAFLSVAMLPSVF